MNNLPAGKYLISLTADGLKIGGQHFSVNGGTQKVTAELDPTPLPLSTIRITVFNDNAPVDATYEVDAESGQLHRGSTFRIRLPGDASRATAGASASTPPGGVAAKVAVEPSGETPQEWPAIEVGKQGWSRQRGRSASTAGRRSDI